MNKVYIREKNTVKVVITFQCIFSVKKLLHKVYASVGDYKVALEL